MTKHTPGPWFHHKAAGSQHTMGGYISAFEARFDGFPLCDVRGTDGQPYEANARLISAAPELLEALIRLFANGAGIPYANWTKTQHDAYAAIQKATGETE